MMFVVLEFIDFSGTGDGDAPLIGDTTENGWQQPAD